MRPGVSVFAVEDTAAQVCWSGLPAGGAVVSAGTARVEVEVEEPGQPGAVVLEGLAPGTAHDLVVTSGDRVVAVDEFRTLVPPPGRLLGRFATLSDLHVGERGFGLLPRVRPDGSVAAGEAFTVRCAEMAMAEAEAWGAGRLVLKGDLTYSGRPSEWEAVAKLLARPGVPVHSTLGNHDVGARSVDGRVVLDRHGVVIPLEPEVVDIEGLRIVIGHSAVPGRRGGQVDGHQRAALVEAVAGAPGPALVTMHHYPDRWPVATRYPRGIPREQGAPLLRALAEANPATFLTFGHSHRHRRGTRRGLPVTEVGSTKDFPGVWAGYAVYEGGLMQTVRRIADPWSMRWTNRTSRVLGGLWGVWTPGRRSWRCFSHPWPGGGAGR